MEQDQQFLENLIKAIVEYPDDVKVKREVDEMGVLLRVWVRKTDMGLIIGRQGVNANAIKLIVKMVGYRSKSHIAIKIEEPNYE